MSAFEEFDACRNILESLLTGVCVVDMQRRIVFWSNGAERITGHLGYEVIRRSCVAEPCCTVSSRAASSAARNAL